jgi:hypothetical protein
MYFNIEVPLQQLNDCSRETGGGVMEWNDVVLFLKNSSARAASHPCLLYP